MIDKEKMKEYITTENWYEIDKEKMKEYIAIQDWYEEEKMKIKENYVKHQDYDLYQDQLEELLSEYDVKLEGIKIEVE